MKTTWLVGLAFFRLVGSSGFATETNLCPPRTQWDRSYGGSASEFLGALIATSDGGFVAAGNSSSLNGDRQSPAYGYSDAWVVRLNSGGDLLWERSFGGSGYDSAGTVAPTDDGGFIVGASSTSNNDGNKTSPGFGGTDYWLIRLDGDGNKLWEKSFGGGGFDDLRTVLPTADGGFLLAGTSNSRIGGTKTSTNFGGSLPAYDFWIIRTDSSGNKLWERSYGGADSDYLGSAVATADGGFLLGGTSYSDADGIKTTAQFGFADYWVVRIDANGEIVWQASFGGQSTDSLESIARASGDGFLIGGVSYSSDGLDKISPYFGGGDYWVVRLNAQGDRLWEASFGGGNYELFVSIQELAGGGFVLGGDSYSMPGGNKTSVGRGANDYWVVRLNASGQKIWEQSYGALGEESFGSVIQTSDGGFAFGGYSSSRPRSGKTAPLLGATDLWIVRIAAETPGDCDGDGVLDASDQCPDTPFGRPVNAAGCSIAQYCPCDGPWASRSNYVACVETNTIAFVAGGIISEAQREALIAEALEADCPPTPQSVVVFGLTNSVLGEAVITSGSSVYSALEVVDTGPNGMDGISIHLGEADSGVFVYPYAGNWGDYSESWFMLGTAYGRVNGQSNALVATLRGTKPYYETYPVEADLSPLAPQSLSILVWSNGVLVADATNSGPIGGVTVRSSSTLGPRANPLWRMPDGTVGALIEFTEGGYQPVVASIEGPFGESEVFGNRIFIRANSPSNVVDFISRLDVVLGGGLTTFSLNDERPGVFGRPHRVLGAALIEPALARLPLTRMAQAYPGEGFGVLAELRGDRQLNLGLEPLALSNASAQLSFSLSGAAELHFRSSTNSLAVYPVFSGFDGYQPLNVFAYRQGILQGTASGTNFQTIGWIAVPDTNEWPRIIGCGGSAQTNSDLAASFSLDRVVTFTGADGTELHGDYFRIAATNAKTYFTADASATLSATDVSAFAITSEDATFLPPPLSIARQGAEYIISWPARNLPLVLESSPTLGQTFVPVEADVTFQDGRYRVGVPAAEQGNRFFRLRLAGD